VISRVPGISDLTAIFFPIGTVPLLWACLLVLLVMLLLLIVFLVWQAKRATLPGEPGNESQKTEDSSGEATASTVVAISEISGSFSGAMHTLRSLVPGRDFRYSVPWFLLLGLPGSGKSSLLSESSLAMSLEEQVEVETGVGIAWNFFGNGIVIDVGGWCFRTDASALSAWRRLLRLFVNHRPERPLDGIVLTIAATDLVGPEALSPTALIERGTLLQQRLRKLTQTIGFHLPISVVITKSDAIKGFSEFTSGLDSDQLEQIFGWSTPYGDSHLFQPEWIDEAIDSMRITLERVQSSFFAIHDPTPDRQSMFLFPGTFYSIAPSLRLLLSRVMRGSGNTPAPMFRGIYFCGSTQSSVRPASTMAGLVPVSQPTGNNPYSFSPYIQEGSSLSWVPSLLEPWLRSNLQIAFTHDLFFKKIFPECGLGVPLSHVFAMRDKMRLALQITCCFTAVVLMIGTDLAHRRLSREQDRLVPLLSRVEADLQRKPDFDLPSSSAGVHPGADDLIHAMTGFQAAGFHSIFLPASWNTNVDHQIQQVIGHVFRVLVLQRFHNGLEQRSQQLADLSRNPISDASFPPSVLNTPPTMTLERLPEYLQMREFLRQVTELDNNIRLYNTLSRRNSDVPLQSVIGLDGYLHHRSQQVAVDDIANPYFKEAIRSAEWPPFIYTNSIRRQMSEKAQQLTNALYGAWIEHNPTRTSTEALVSSLVSLSTSGVHSYQDLAEVEHSFDKVQRSTADPQLQWTGADQIHLPNALGVVTIEAANGSPFFQPWLRDWMLDLADSEFRKLAAALDDAQAPLTGNVLSVTEGKLELSQRSQNAQIAIENLMSLPFMADISGSVNPIQPGSERITWNKASLNAATMLPISYERYLNEDLGQAPAALRNTLSHIAANQLNRALQVAIVESEQSANSDSSGSERAQAFGDAAPSINALMATLQQNNLAEPLIQLRQISTGQAAAIMLALDHDLDNVSPYGFSTAVFSRWDGRQPASVQIFDASTPDDLAAYLSSQRDEIESYNTAASPLVRFLSGYRSSLSPASIRILNRWEDIGIAVNQYHTKKPGNSIQLLENFVTAGVDKILPSKGCSSERPAGSIAKRPDYFTLVGAQLRQGLYLRCNALLTEDFETIYSRLHARFNHDLAGRFPFAPASSSTLNEADLQTITDFYRQYDSSSDLLDAGLKGAGAGNATENFLAMLRDSRPWFASLLTTTSEGDAATLDIVPQFRVNREGESGGNQIIDWTLQIGAHAVHGDTPPAKLRWNYGDPVSLTLRWAKDSPFVPMNISNTTNSQSMHVDGDSVSWTFKDGWSLIRLIQTLTAFDKSHWADRGVESDQPFVLSLDIPQVAASSTTVKLQAQTIKSAQVFVRLAISSPGSKETITKNSFPVLAPSVSKLQPGQTKGQ
jgi:type VI secretion system protein ImpL